MRLFAADVSIENAITMDPQRAKALENDIRTQIVNTLADEEYILHEPLNRALTDSNEDGALDEVLD